MNLAEKLVRDGARERHQSSGPYEMLFELFAEKGHAFSGKNSFTAEEQDVLIQVPLAIKPSPKSCYRNSQRAVMKFPNQFQYAEGFFANHDAPCPFHHAWLFLHAKLVDLTVDANEYDYFGVLIPRDLVQNHILRMRAFGHLNDWDNRWEFTERILGPIRRTP